MVHPVVKQNYTHLQGIKAMDFLNLYIAVNKNEDVNAISSSRLNQL